MVSDEVISPFTYGILKPVIVLPETLDMSNHALLDYILTHEYIHIKRFDVILKWLSAAALCVNWFNPLVWVMYVLFCRDIELSCDEGVVRFKGGINKKSYALALLDMEAVKQSFNPLFSRDAFYIFDPNASYQKIAEIIDYWNEYIGWSDEAYNQMLEDYNITYVD